MSGSSFFLTSDKLNIYYVNSAQVSAFSKLGLNSRYCVENLSIEILSNWCRIKHKN